HSRGKTDGWSHALGVSADGRTVAFGQYQHVTLWDPLTGRRHGEEYVGEAVRTLAFSPTDENGQTLAMLSDYDRIVWDLGSAHGWAERHRGDTQDTCFAYTPDGLSLFVGSGGDVRRVDLRTGEETATRLAGCRVVNALACSRDGSAVAAGACPADAVL